MLVRFAVGNFRSIRDREELTMVPSAFYKDRTDIFAPCDAVPTNSLLPSAVIYGPNAAGKSNFKAIRARGS